jgi:hypothetical protein
MTYPFYTKTFMSNGLVFSYNRVNSEDDIFSIKLILATNPYPSCGDNCIANALSERHEIISQKEFAKALREFKKLIRQIQP